MNIPNLPAWLPEAVVATMMAVIGVLAVLS